MNPQPHFLASHMNPVTLDLKATIEAAIESLGLESKLPANLYKPMAYILSLKGKRIRPVLTMLAYQAVSGKSAEEAIDIAVAVELFHNFTLMHDDIMDRAPMRRGKPTAHIVWDENIAILSGDALFAYSIEKVVSGFPDKGAALSIEFSKVAMGVCEGQMEDMDMAMQDEVTIPVYLEMIRKKTAVLLGGCMSMGAIAGGASPAMIARFREFGESMGMAFQLQDDLMDAFPPEGFGKQVGGDIIENKKTYLLLKALEGATPQQKKELEILLEETEDTQKKVTETLALFQALGVPNATQQLIETYVEKARNLAHEISTQVPFEDIKTYLEVIAKRKL